MAVQQSKACPIELKHEIVLNYQLFASEAYQLFPQLLVAGFLQGGLPLPGVPLRLGHEDVLLAGLVGKYDGERAGVDLEALLLKVEALEDQDSERFAAERRSAVVGRQPEVKEAVGSKSKPSGVEPKQYNSIARNSKYFMLPLKLTFSRQTYFIIL